MVEKVKILMIDDHSLILEGYKSKLLESFEKNELLMFIDTAHNCDEAFEKIKRSSIDGAYDYVFLDINLPSSQDQKFLSGEDLGKKIKELTPDTSILVLTMYSENLRLLNILRNLNPEAFLIKSDVTPQEFLRAFNKVRAGEVYYSQSVTNLMRSQLTSNIVLDDNDRKILYHLSKGIRTKDLVDIVPLSLAAIEKRKKMMKEVFEIENGDLALINRAKDMGFL